MDDLSKMTARARHHVTEDGRLADGSSGGGGVIYVPNMDDSYLTAYADEACTKKLTYEQGKAIASRPFVLRTVSPGGTEFNAAVLMPIAAMCADAEKVVMVVCVSEGAEALIGGQKFLLFSDSPAGV